MHRILLSLVLALSSVTSAYAKPKSPHLPVSIVCFGEQPDCPRAVHVAFRALELLEAQVDVNFDVVSTREMPLPEIDPDTEVFISQFIAQDIYRMDGAHLSLFISPRADYNVLGVSYVGVVGERPAATINHLIPDEKLSRDVVAHEIAHALGAEHDVSGLMTPAVSDKRHSGILSKRCRDQIKEHLKGVPVQAS